MTKDNFSQPIPYGQASQFFIAGQRDPSRYAYPSEINAEYMIGTDFPADVQGRMEQIITLLGGSTDGTVKRKRLRRRRHGRKRNLNRNESIGLHDGR